MSIDYEATLCVGVTVDLSAIVLALGKDCKEQSHMEKRFNPKNGKPMLDERVLDRPFGISIMLNGKEIEFLDGVKLADYKKEDGRTKIPFDSLQKLATYAGLQYGYNEGWSVCSFGKFRDSLATAGWIKNSWNRAERGRKKLIKLGIKVDDPVRAFGWLYMT